MIYSLGSYVMRQMYDYMLLRIYHFFREHPGETPSVGLSVAFTASMVCVMNLATIYLLLTHNHVVPQLPSFAEKIVLLVVIAAIVGLNYFHLHKGQLFFNKKIRFTHKRDRYLTTFLAISALSFILFAIIAHGEHLG